MDYRFLKGMAEINFYSELFPTVMRSLIIWHLNRFSSKFLGGSKTSIVDERLCSPILNEGFCHKNSKEHVTGGDGTRDYRGFGFENFIFRAATFSTPEGAISWTFFLVSFLSTSTLTEIFGSDRTFLQPVVGSFCPVPALLLITGKISSHFARKGPFLSTSTYVQVTRRYTSFSVPGFIHSRDIWRQRGMHSSRPYRWKRWKLLSTALSSVVVIFNILGLRGTCIERKNSFLHVSKLDRWSPNSIFHLVLLWMEHGEGKWTNWTGHGFGRSFCLIRGAIGLCERGLF